MKKIILLALISLFVVSIGVSAADYHIEWFNLPDESKIWISGKNYFIIKEEYGFNYYFCDEEGNMLAKVSSSDIKMLQNKKFTFVNDKKIFDYIYSCVSPKKRNEIPTLSYEDILRGFFGEELQTNVPKKVILGYEEYDTIRFGEYLILKKQIEQSDSGYVLADKNGKMLSGIIFNMIFVAEDNNKTIILYNTETEDAAFINLNGKMILTKIPFGYLFAPFYVVENENQTYNLLRNDLETIATGFDSISGNIGGSFAFEKNGEKYVYDDMGNFLYKGTENVEASLFQRYIIRENGKLKLTDLYFNELLPAEYDYIRPIAENVWIVKKNMVESVINNGKKVVDGFYEIYLKNNYLIAEDVYITQGMESNKNNITIKSHTVYDFEGNIVYNGEGNICFTENRIIIEKDGKIGKLVSNNSNPHLKINGEYLYTDTLPRIRNNITLVPIRAIAEKLGFEVSFKDGEIKITKDGKEIIFNIESRKAVINGEEKELSAPSEIINDRTLVPIRAVAEAFEMKIEWNEDLRTVELMHNS